MPPPESTRAFTPSLLAHHLFQLLGEIDAGFGPEAQVVDGKRLPQVADQVEQAANVGLDRAKSAWGLGLRQVEQVQAEVEEDVLAVVAWELRTEAGEDYGRRRKRPVIIELPQVPISFDLIRAVGILELAGAGDHFLYGRVAFEAL